MQVRKGPTNDVTKGGGNNVQSKNPLRPTQSSFRLSQCAVALQCCAFSIEPLFAQELDWAYYGNDVSNSRYQDIDQITTSNISQLKPAWIFHTGAAVNA